MATVRTPATSPPTLPHGLLTPDELIGLYRTMVTSRRLDDEEIRLKKLNLIFFQISGAGHEAVLAAAGKRAEAGLRLVLSLLPRPRAVPPAGHDAARRCCSRPSAARDDPQLGRAPDAEPLGPQEAQHRLRSSSPTGTQFLQAVGAAEALVKYKRPGGRASRRCEARSSGDEVVLVPAGDGTTSEGEFWEAHEHRLQPQAPGAVPDRGQRLRDLGPGGRPDRGRQRRATWCSNFPNLFWVGEINGSDPVESYGVLRRGGRPLPRPQGSGVRARPGDRGPTRTRCRTTSPSARPRPSATKRPQRDCADRPTPASWSRRA